MFHLNDGEQRREARFYVLDSWLAGKLCISVRDVSL